MKITIRVHSFPDTVRRTSRNWQHSQSPAAKHSLPPSPSFISREQQYWNTAWVKQTPVEKMGKRRHSHESHDRPLKHQRTHPYVKDELGPEKVAMSSTKPAILTSLKVELTVSLLPAGLKNVRRSVQESMQQFLLKYSTGLKGVPITFSNMKLLKNGKGSILNELPYIHYAISCDIVLFAPKAGDRLTGRLRKSFHSHLSLVVLNYFNTSISADVLHERGYTYDPEEEQWSNSESIFLSVDELLTFQVLKVHESAGIISIDGTDPFLIKA